MGLHPRRGGQHDLVGLPHRLASVSGSTAAESFTYNPVGWLTSTHDGFGTSVGGFDTTFTYDAAGRVTALDSDAAPAVTYAYDLAGRLASLTLPGSGAATFAHDAAGARTGVTLPTGALTSYGYDTAGRVASITTTATSGVIAESYTRDAAGRVTTDSSGAYAYDDAGRLETWTAPDDTLTTYTYDAASNLVGASVDGSATAAFAYDAADRITSPGLSYDDAGNLTSDGDRTFTYDAAGRLTAVADASTETTIAAYAYDAFNRRVSATEGGATVFFHYDGASARVIAETDGAGAALASYTYDASGALFSMSRGSETYFYHLNARGDVVALSDSTGAVVNTYAYDPWGQLLSATETVTNPYRYASYRYDTSTGLYYCWNRYYAPELARFLTRDIYPGELSDPVTMNPYLYCGGDPVNAVDPSGLWTTGASIGAEGGIWTWLAGSVSWGGAYSVEDFLTHGADAPLTTYETGAWRVGGCGDPEGNTSIDMVGNVSGGPMAQITSADDPSQLAGPSRRWGFNADWFAADFVLGEGYWGIQYGVGFGGWDVHYFEENTKILSSDALAGLR